MLIVNYVGKKKTPNNQCSLSKCCQVCGKIQLPHTAAHNVAEYAGIFNHPILPPHGFIFNTHIRITNYNKKL